ncbi:exonuclease SbcCD subunit D [Brochothrix thermosphacta]|uniref:exonuclease SbcCD subunit D n=1 Tax=Brochothrix thermosphacta TaxID=2756 RepID=UPI002712E344|nr:exonuclease SbcCD subunit D [Brochothrix thermosphacta]MDO7863075.1 exonuclease SbcCD subunit D [Brochothrix thermosphacta]
MKIVHTADWHLGKIVSGQSLTEDQAYQLQQLVELLKDEAADVLMIAGDLYDRAIPPLEAVELLNETLATINLELKIPIVAISGNHDSSNRLNFGSSWYQKNGFYLTTQISQIFKPVTIGDVQFWLIPFFENLEAAAYFEDSTIRTQEAAMRRIIEQIEPLMDRSKRQIAMAHLFVTGAEPSESERPLAMGGVDAVSAKLFKAFDYTALGHLHRPHALVKITTDTLPQGTVSYSGSLLKYSFSEVKDQKSVRIITVPQKGELQMREVPLHPQRDMRLVKAEMAALLAEPTAFGPVDDYLQITLTDVGDVYEPMRRLKEVFPHLLHLERAAQTAIHQQGQQFKDLKQADILTLFSQFFETVEQQPLTDVDREFMQNVIDESRRGE